MNCFLPVIDNINLHNQYLDNDKKKQPIILCDFDGTISLKDVTDLLLSHFGQDGCDELEQLWEDGIIGSQECMSKQIALMDASLAELNAVLSTVKIDETFKQFVKIATEKKITIQIVSDGLDYAIYYILKHNQLDFLPIFANRLLHDKNRHWRLDFPYANLECIKASGNCKCQHLKIQQQHFDNIYYVGDGTSDFCVSNRVDLVFAKDKLINYCEQNNIRHYPIKHFADIMPILEKNDLIISTNL